MQFGDDIMGSATDEMRAMLERKNHWKRDFHIGRLQEQGMMPHKASQPRRDPEDDAVDDSIGQRRLHHHRQSLAD